MPENGKMRWAVAYRYLRDDIPREFITFRTRIDAADWLHGNAHRRRVIRHEEPYFELIPDNLPLTKNTGISGTRPHTLYQMFSVSRSARAIMYAEPIIHYRIRALIDLPQHGVKAGDIGGFVSGYHNVRNGAWIGGNAEVEETAVVADGSLVFGNARVCGKSVVLDSIVFDSALIYGNVTSSLVTGMAYVEQGEHVENASVR